VGDLPKTVNRHEPNYRAENDLCLSAQHGNDLFSLWIMNVEEVKRCGACVEVVCWGAEVEYKLGTR
jgi:hypothetical protein